MDFNVSFKHMDTSDSLRQFTREKTSELEKYFRGRISVNWNFSRQNQACIVHCHLVGDHMDYFVEVTTEDFKDAIEAAVKKMDRKVRKHKEIVKDHLHRNSRVSA
ncbi:MAG: ribosome hibernation-promoting factor, HPF/YfiA family [Bdellovibrionota bacterium]